MAVNLSALAGAGQQFFDNSGVILSGGKLYSYAAGTSTPQVTYTSASGSTAHTNPIVLDSAGRIATGEIWLTAGSNYKFALYTSANVLIATWDNITGINGTGITTNASSVQYDPAGTGAVSTTVQAKLRETVSVEDFGADPTGTADSTTAIQAAITSLTTGQTLNMAGIYKTNTGFTISNKTKIRITGNGTINLTGAGTSAYVFQLVGTCSQIEIDHLTITGDNNATYGQSAIGAASGQTISNTSFHDLNISNINIGISHNCYLSGSWDKGLCYNNSLKNLVGTSSGQGYAIHMAKATNIRVYDNVIDNASRHAIYQAAGIDVNNIIHNNLIVNHRSTVADASYRVAIVCSRSSNVTISNNKMLNGYDGAMEIGHVTADSFNASNILVIGNTFTGRKNVVPYMLIGEQAIPGATYSTFKITIQDNIFDSDYTLASGTDDINIQNGTDIYIENNKFRRYNYTGSSLVEFIGLGADVYLNSDSQINNISIKNNTATIDALASSARFVTVCTQLCTGSSTYLIKDNFTFNVGVMYNFTTTPTNVNSKLKFVGSYSYTAGSAQAANTCIPITSIGATGTKPTSQVVIRPQYTPTPNGLVFTAFAHDSSVNTIQLYCANVTVGAITIPSQTFLYFVEDFN